MSAKNVQDIRKAMGKPMATSGSRVKKRKGKPQPRTPMERVLVIRNNRRVFEWREWGS